MSWKKYFSPVASSTAGTVSPIFGNGGKPGPARTNYSSYLPDVYTGSPNRVERYMQYDTMDNDSEVNAALDILAEFCTQKNKENGTPFTLHFRGNPTTSEVLILKEYLQQWTKMQKLDQRMFRIARNLFKYGDGFFLRDPETQKWFYVDPAKIVKIIVNESEGKMPEQYVLRDINVNFQHLVVTQINPNSGNQQPGGAAYVQGGSGARGMTGNFPQQTGTRFSLAQNEQAIDAKHVVHISLSEGLDNSFPFGPSLLESVFKVYKQKELLEDAIIIYRVQRAPERRVFYIDVGNMPSHLAMGFVERVKNEIHQRRIPSSTGGGSAIDSSYNPLSINEDYFFPQTAEGRGSKVETLPGGTNLGEIDDLKYFTNKLMRALRIPSSYLPTGADDSQAQYNDGRVGTAFIQELRFNKYCERLQGAMVETFDTEFKLFLHNRGVNIDFSLFELRFQSPQNFAAYRQSELDNQRIGTFAQMVALPFVSKRFALKRFLGMTDEDLVENERMWSEENSEGTSGATDAAGQLRGAGVSPTGMETDMAEVDGSEEAPEDMLGGDEMETAAAPETPTA
jgi:Bacteriophage T4-like portal protein (Gp20)